MPRKAQGWITFQSSDEERRILEEICQQTQRTKTEVLREMIRQLGRSSSPTPPESKPVNFSEKFSEELEEDLEENFEENFEDGGEDTGEDAINAVNTAPIQAVQISARNILKAKVKRIVKGTVSAEVTLTIAPGVELVSIVTRTSADKLGLKQGKDVFAVIKSNNVMIAAG